MRIDAIGQLPKNKTAIFSIEFGNDSLSLPRKILENFAILHRRYNKDKNNIIPFAIVNEVPNKRSEYYRVLGDVYKVTKIKIYTLSIFNLILWVKNKKRISDFIFDDFFITNKKNNKFIKPKK